MGIRSMTGFGEAEASIGAVAIRVEIRAVNHRFLDVNCKLPNLYSRLESDISRQIKGVLRRGRVDVSITRVEEVKASEEILFRGEVFDSYLNIGKEAMARAGVKGKDFLPQLVIEVLRRREVLEVGTPEKEIQDESELVQATVQEALKKHLSMRENEGKALEKDIRAQLAQLEKLAKSIQEFSTEWPKVFHEKLRTRLERLGPSAEIDASRLAQEVAILADRVDITEELVRLASHISQFREVLADAESGKKMEFLLQEMGREVNTTGSKSQSAEISGFVVEAKAVLEKIREQVLNIE